MANGTTRNALSEMVIKNKKPTSEMEIEKSYDSKLPAKIPLKNPTKNNHSK